MSGWNELYKDSMNPSKPLKTDNTIIRERVPTETPSIEIPVIIFITLKDFLEKRYRRAINRGRFKSNRLEFNHL